MAHEGRDAEVLLALMTLEITNKSVGARVGARGGASTSNAKRTKGPLPVLPATRLLLSYELSARTWAMLGLSTPRGFSNMSDNDTGVIAYTAEGHLCMRKCSVRTMCGILARYLLTHGTYVEHHEGRTAYHLACALSLIDEQSISDDDLYDEHAEGARELEPARSYFTTDMLLGFLRAHGYTVREAVDDLPSTGRPTDPAELRYAPLAYAQSATSSPPLRNLAVGEECGPESSQKPTSSYWIRGGERGEVIFSKSLPLLCLAAFAVRLAAGNREYLEFKDGAIVWHLVAFLAWLRDALAYDPDEERVRVPTIAEMLAAGGETYAKVKTPAGRA